MVLYERYGDDYDRVVAAMTTEEKRRLKREVNGSEAKTVIELLGRELVEAEGDLQRVRSVVSAKIWDKVSNSNRPNSNLCH